MLHLSHNQQNEHSLRRNDVKPNPIIFLCLAVHCIRTNVVARLFLLIFVQYLCETIDVVRSVAGGEQLK